ncbi:MAG: hypothetical protein ACSLFK_11200, partial [Gemmatimonadaceae bacterium]
GDPGPDPGDRRDPSGERKHDRRRGGWRDFRRAYPGFVFTLIIGLIAMLAIDAFLILKRQSYEAEVARLRAGMTEQEKGTTDAIIAAEENKLKIALALARRQAKLEKTLHLSVAVDSGKIYLEREGAVLREMAAAFGPDGMVSTGADSIPLVVPRGERSILKVDPNGITLDGGLVIAASDAPSLAQLADSMPPGSVRISRSDLKAITPNLNLGMRVFFF